MRIKNKPTYKHQFIGVLIAATLLTLTFGINQSLHSSNTVDVKSEVVLGEGVVAEFPGGQKALFEFIGKNIEYPKHVKESGTVYIKFKVGEDGQCSEFKEVKAFNKDCSTAAMAALKKMPKWKPATKNGKKVSSEITIPVRFEPSAKK